jgi:hypothetical protein
MPNRMRSRNTVPLLCEVCSCALWSCVSRASDVHYNTKHRRIVRSDYHIFARHFYSFLACCCSHCCCCSAADCREVSGKRTIDDCQEHNNICKSHQRKGHVEFQGENICRHALFMFTHFSISSESSLTPQSYANWFMLCMCATTDVRANRRVEKLQS